MNKILFDRFKIGILIGLLLVCGCKKEPLTLRFIQQAPKLLSPDNKSSGLLTAITFQWEELSGSSEYELQISENLNFEPLFLNRVGIKSTMATLSNISYGTTFYWRIRAVNKAQEISLWSEVWIFSVKKNNSPLIPKLIYPENGAVGQPVNLVLKWSAKDPEGDSLVSDIYFDKVNPPINIVGNGVKDSSFSLTNLDRQQQYYWRIVTKDSYNNITEGPVWSFITKPDPWSVAPSLNYGRYFHAAAAAGGKIYVLGGDRWDYDYWDNTWNQTYTQAIEEFTPGNTKWIDVGKMGFARSGLAAAGVGDMIYFAGGEDEFSGKKEFYSFSSSTYSIEGLADLEVITSNLCGVSSGSKAYFISGQDMPLLSRLTNEYNPSINTWKRLESIITPRWGATASELNSKIYVCGGMTSYTSTNIFEVFDIQNNHWNSLQAAPFYSFAAASAECNGKIYLFGGFTGILPYYIGGESRVSSQTWEYDPVKDTWTEKAPMKSPLMGSCAVTIGNKIYVIGGYDGYGFISNVWIYDPTID